jgi:hypothetical protein
MQLLSERDQNPDKFSGRLGLGLKCPATVFLSVVAARLADLLMVESR